MAKICQTRLLNNNLCYNCGRSGHRAGSCDQQAIASCVVAAIKKADYEEVNYTLTQEKLEFKKKKEGIGHLDVGDLTEEERQRLEDVLSKSESTKGRFR